MGRGIRITLLAAAAVVAACAPASGAAITLPLVDKCLEPQTPPAGLTQVSPNVEDLGTLIGEAGSLNAGGRLVGHYFYVTGSPDLSTLSRAAPPAPPAIPS